MIVPMVARKGISAAPGKAPQRDEPALAAPAPGHLPARLDPRSLTSRQLVMLQRGAGNAAVARLVQPDQAVSRSVPERPRPKLPTRGRGALVQRDVGFEFQTGWGIRERGPYRMYNRQEVVVDFGSFRFTADEAQTPLGAEIEYVVPHVAENNRNQMDAALQALEQHAQDMDAHRGETIFTLDRATQNVAHNRVEVHPTIKTTGTMKANPQTTGGVRMDRLTQMFTDLGHNQGAHAGAQHALVATGGGGGLANAAALVANMTVNGHPASAKFKGLAATIVTYLQMGRANVGGMPMPTLNYAKASLTLLARTDFRRMYQLLPNAEKAYYTAHPKRFRREILAVVGNLDPNANVLERGVHNHPVNITRRAWLEGIPAGTDLLKQQTDARLFGFGSRNKHTDPVGPAQGRRGAIFEFRTMGRDIPYTQWHALGMSIFDYIVALNQ